MMIRNLALMVTSVLLTLAIAEAVLHIAYEPSTAFIEGTLLTDSAYHRQDPELQIVPRSLVRGEHTKRGSFASTFTTNSHGLRGREIAFDRKPGVTRIAVIGDSFAWGYGVNDDATFPAQLERRLPDTEVVNFGVSGYGLHEEIAYFRRLGVLFQPDILIVALVQNDIAVGEVRGAAALRQEAAAAPLQGSADDATPGSGFGSLKRRLAGSSRLYSLLSDAINGNRALVELAVRLGIKAEPGGLEALDFNLMPALREQPEPVRAGWDRTFERLRSLHAFTDSLRIRLIVGLVPAAQSVDPAQLRRSLVRSRYWIDDFDVDEPYRRLAHFADAESIEVVNPLDDFRRALDSGDALYLNRDMHFNERGHALFAAAIIVHLARDSADSAPHR